MQVSHFQVASGLYQSRQSSQPYHEGSSRDHTDGTEGEMPISLGILTPIFLEEDSPNSDFRTTDDSTVDEGEKLAAGIHGQIPGKTQCDIRSKTKIRQKMNLSE